MARKETPRPSVRRESERTARRAPKWAVIALAGALAVGGTAAFLFDETNKVVNTFQLAEVTCEVVEDFDGATKSNVGVKNTGDVDAFLRATVVANWAKQGADGVLEVYPEMPSAADYTIMFDQTAAGKDTPWVKHDGYWYYTLPVAPNAVAENLILTCAPVEGRAPEGYALYVDIICSAIQSEPSAAVQEAWGVSISGGAVTAVSGE